ncbi:C40 family peptidase [Oerskovia turbata]
MVPLEPTDSSKDPPGITRRSALQGAGVFALIAAMGLTITPPAVASAPTTDQFIALCRAQIGKQYVFGAAGPNTFDCSGLIHWALGQLGITSPRPSGGLIGFTQAIPLEQGYTTPGALLYYGASGSRRAHIAVSLGNNRVIEAANEALDVTEGRARGRPWTHAGTIAQLATTPAPAPEPVPEIQEDQMVVILNKSNNAAIVVSGGKAAPIIGWDMYVTLAQTLPSVGVTNEQFNAFTTAFA